jgi:hypothetical protein
LAAAIGITQNAAANPAIYEVGSDPTVGFNLISWWNFDNTSTPGVDEGVSIWQNAVQSVYNAGFREVSISPVRYFDLTTFAIAPTSGKGPELTSIDAAVTKAKQLGMRVTLNPFVEPNGSSNWRGTYNPQGTAGATFWNDYQNYMVAVAQIGQAHGVDAMTIGTELKAMDGDNNNSAHWAAVINSVDNVYHGSLGYAANWDDYRNANVQANIWENSKIDYVGIDSYFNTVLYDYVKYANPTLTTTQINTIVSNAVNPIQSYPDQSFVDLMTNAWNKFLDIDSATVTSGGRTYFQYDGILPYAAARKGGAGMPVQFTEQGYEYFNLSSASPQTTSGSTDNAEQVMAFEGLLRALDGRQQKLSAVDIWQWEMPGSQGSTWNINPTQAANQFDNRRLANWLSRFVRNIQPSDYNGDGLVDNQDYVMWRKTSGNVVELFDRADGNGSGTVDPNDYSIWRLNFGAAPSSGLGNPESVPEPAAAWLLLSAICSRSCGRRLRRR